MRNGVVDRFRHRVLRWLGSAEPAERSVGSDHIDVRLAATEAREWLRRNLDDDLRETFELRYVRGLNSSEIAQRQLVSETTVDLRLHRIRKTAGRFADRAAPLTWDEWIDADPPPDGLDWDTIPNEEILETRAGQLDDFLADLAKPLDTRAPQSGPGHALESAATDLDQPDAPVEIFDLTDTSDFTDSSDFTDPIDGPEQAPTEHPDRRTGITANRVLVGIGLGIGLLWLATANRDPLEVASPDETPGPTIEAPSPTPRPSSQQVEAPNPTPAPTTTPHRNIRVTCELSTTQVAVEEPFKIRTSIDVSPELWTFEFTFHHGDGYEGPASDAVYRSPGTFDVSVVWDAQSQNGHTAQFGESPCGTITATAAPPTPAPEVPAREGATRSLAILSDGTIASGERAGERTVQIWHPDTPEVTAVTHRGHEDAVTAIAQLHDGRIASGSADTTIRIWHPNNPDVVTILSGSCCSGTSGISSLVVLADHRLAVAERTRTIRIWDPADPSEGARLFQGHNARVTSLIQLDDGRIASGDESATVLLWDPDDPTAPHEAFTGHDEPLDITSLIQLDDGRIASGDDSGTILIWDPDNPNAPTEAFTGHDEVVWSLIQLSDGRIASGDDSGTILIWDPQDQSRTPYTMHTDEVWSIVQLADDRIVSAGRDGIRIWRP